MPLRISASSSAASLREMASVLDRYREKSKVGVEDGEAITIWGLSQIRDQRRRGREDYLDERLSKVLGSDKE